LGTFFADFETDFENSESRAAIFVIGDLKDCSIIIWCFKKKVLSLQQISISKFGMYVPKSGIYIPKFGMAIAKFETKKERNSMANYVIKEMPAGMGNGKKGRIFPKMQVYTEFDYDKVVELIHTNSPAFSQATIRGVLDTFGVVLKNYLPMGHTMKIDNLGVFSLALEFADEMTEKDAQLGAQDTAPKTNYRHVKVKGVNFKVDKKLIKEINRENSFERVSGNTVSRSPYSIEERLQRAVQHIDKHGFITLQDYANLNRLSRSSASRELSKFVSDPTSGIQAKGAGSHKVWVCK
jgi:predicted histone-like DNA-binding protein